MESILIIEDDEPTAQLMVSVLESLGHPLLLAPNATRGLALAQEHEISLILLDMRLPGMDGWELVPILRAEYTMPIIAVSVQICINDSKNLSGN
jgi:CheY-like chemotaxis protein